MLRIKGLVNSSMFDSQGGGGQKGPRIGPQFMNDSLILIIT